MEPHNEHLREVAAAFGWTWYRMRRLIDAHLSAHGASFARLRLLAFLAEQPARSTDIAAFFDHAPRSVTEAIDWLEKNGLATRSPIPGDRRAKLVEITDAGRALLDQGMPLFDGIIEKTFGSLTGAELAGIDAAISHLNGAVAQLEKEAGFSRMHYSPRVENGD